MFGFQSPVLGAKKCLKAKNYYKSQDLALWLNLLPKFDHQDAEEGNVTHDLDFAENMTTFEEPQRLLEDFYRSKYPRSPYPTVPPLYWTSCPPEEELEVTTMMDEFTGSDYWNETTTYTYSKTMTPKTNTGGSKKKSIAKSAIPLSIVVAVGCALIFLNLLICAGMYYHRKRMRKLRERPGQGNGNDVSDNRNNDRNMNSDITRPDIHSQENNLPKVANMNHKSHVDSLPMYTSIVKPTPTPQGPGGYTYSALSQKSSPMHNHIHLGGQHMPNRPPSEDGSLPSKKIMHDSNARSQGVAQPSPKIDPRIKQIQRANHQPTSNNAITIV